MSSEPQAGNDAGPESFVARAGARAHATVRQLADRLRRLSTAAKVEIALLGAILTYGALLRFEAFQRVYGPLQGAAWWVRLQGGVADLVQAIRPESFAWPRGEFPYRFDAKSYIDSARAMTHFYEARLREPLFVFSTKVGQWLTGDQDIAVSMVSGFFSTLIILATYVLGRSIGGAAVGLLGALFIAIERELIWTGTAGYRDDLFTLLTVLFAYACIRLYDRPSMRAAVATGVIAGLACLTRITALSFVVPGLLAVALSHGLGGLREVYRPALVSGLIAMILLAPFLVTCWMEFGDPLYSINWHAGFYSTRAGMEGTEAAEGSGSFLVSQLRDQPARTVHTGLRGLTAYPWGNKWHGLSDHWGSPLGGALKWLSVIGVLMWIWLPKGRMALWVFVASMLPFAFTWELPGGAQWRLTMHAYAFLLPAAAYAVVEPFRWGRRLVAAPESRGEDLRKLGRRAASTAALVLAFLAVLSILTPIAVAHDLSRGRPASVGGGNKDELMFGGGWRETRREGNITFHYPEADRGVIRVPMSGGRAYEAFIRLDALPEVAGAQDVFEFRVNRQWSERFTVEGNPNDVGRHRFWIPEGVVRGGLNRIELVALGGPGADTPGEQAAEGPRFRLWYVRFFPQAR